MAELLSPAGGWDSLVAAVQSGADAVYMGFGAYNARRSAKNFTEEEFAKAVRYCHLRGVRVYLTLNTLLTDRELPGAAELLHKASRLGADAVLIQDWGVWQLARQAAPELPLHASTQMSLHTLGGARRAAELGLTRVVLARELSRRDIAAICRDCPAEVEVFAHGALCMCYSGQCALSAVIGGRSGNRGTCAQPCRLPLHRGERPHRPNRGPLPADARMGPPQRAGEQPHPLSGGQAGVAAAGAHLCPAAVHHGIPGGVRGGPAAVSGAGGLYPGRSDTGSVLPGGRVNTFRCFYL